MIEIMRNPRTPWHLWLVGVLSLLWNAIGGWQIWLKLSGNAGYWNALTAEESAYLAAAPLWTDVAASVAVIAGVLGALLLLARIRIAAFAFIIGLAAWIADNVYVHMLSDGTRILGVGMGILVTILFILQIAYAAWMAKRGVLR
jgi:hypothetical protein